MYKTYVVIFSIGISFALIGAFCDSEKNIQKVEIRDGKKDTVPAQKHKWEVYQIFSMPNHEIFEK